MEHFAARDWADYIRQAAQTDIQKHLDHQCPECLRTLAVWKSVVEIVAREARYQAPPESVQFVKGVFAATLPPKKLSLAARLANLVYDSLEQPLLAGVRSSTAVARQLLHRCGDLVIDLRVETRPGPHRLGLMGQILNSNHPERYYTGAGVVLLQGEKVVAHTFTNQFGEFSMECEPRPGLALFIESRNDMNIVISLKTLDEKDHQGLKAS